MLSRFSFTEEVKTVSEFSRELFFLRRKDHLSLFFFAPPLSAEFSRDGRPRRRPGHVPRRHHRVEEERDGSRARARARRVQGPRRRRRSGWGPLRRRRSRGRPPRRAPDERLGHLEGVVRACQRPRDHPCESLRGRENVQKSCRRRRCHWFSFRRRSHHSSDLFKHTKKLLVRHSRTRPRATTDTSSSSSPRARASRAPSSE